MFDKKKCFHPFQSLKKWLRQLEASRHVHEAVENLILSSKLDPKFFIMCLLSGLMAALGIMLEDTVILIAAMVLAPLLNPLLALAAGVVLVHGRLVIYALKSFLGGFLPIIFITALFVKILVYFGQDVESMYIYDFTKRFTTTSSSLLISLVAHISGMAAVYSWLRPTNNANLVGVAIAVSLIPFISFLGVSMGLNEWNAFASAGLILAYNLLSIVSGAIIMFFLLGFNSPKSRIDGDIKEAASG